MLLNKYLLYTYILYIYFTTLLAFLFGTLTNLSLSLTFHNVLGTLWERFVGHFEKYLYLFIQSSHFVRGICLPEVGQTMNFAIMLWRCFLTTLWGNIVITVWKLSWNMLQQQQCANVFTTFPQRCGNVSATIYLLHEGVWHPQMWKFLYMWKRS